MWIYIYICLNLNLSVEMALQFLHGPLLVHESAEDSPWDSREINEYSKPVDAFVEPRFHFFPGKTQRRSEIYWSLPNMMGSSEWVKVPVFAEGNGISYPQERKEECVCVYVCGEELANGLGNQRQISKKPRKYFENGDPTQSGKCSMTRSSTAWGRRRAAQLLGYSTLGSRSAA